MEMMIFIIAVGLLAITFLYGVYGGVKAAFLIAGIALTWHFIETLL